MDKSFSKEDIEKIINADFETTFPARITYASLTKSAYEKLKNVSNDTDLFSAFDNTTNLGNGYVAIEIDDYCNIIDKEKNILSPNLWFQDIGSFYDGFFVVIEPSMKFTFIDTNGQIGFGKNLSFDFANHFSDGLASIYTRNKGWTIINTNGDIVIDYDALQEYNDIGSFNEGVALVRKNDKYSFINAKGELLWGNNANAWFDYLDDRFFDGYVCMCENNYGWTFVDKRGRCLKNGGIIFNAVEHFKDGFAKVQNKHTYKWSYINTKGDLAFGDNSWFDYVHSFYNGLGEVEDNFTTYFVDVKGQFYTEDMKPISNPKSVRKESIESFDNMITEVLNSFILKKLK